MNLPSTPVILIGSGAALWAWQHNSQASAGELTAPTASPIPSRQPLAALGMAVPVGRKVTMMATAGQILVAGNKGQSPLRSASFMGHPLVTSGGENGSRSEDIGMRQQLIAIEAKAKEEYNKLTTEAKKRAAAELNKISPSPGLTGNESFEEASKKVGAAIGSIAGTAACNAIPIPGVATVAAHTVCATLGAMIGAYLGDKLGRWAKDMYSDVKEWAAKAWDDVKGVAEDAGDAVSDAAKKVGGVIGDLF